jgi:hypothetical protein
VYVPGSGDELDMGIATDGQMFGEALDPSTALAIPRDEWLHLMVQVPDLGQRVLLAVGVSVRRCWRLSISSSSTWRSWPSLRMKRGRDEIQDFQGHDVLRGDAGIDRITAYCGRDLVDGGPGGTSVSRRETSVEGM